MHITLLGLDEEVRAMRLFPEQFGYHKNNFCLRAIDMKQVSNECFRGGRALYEIPKLSKPFSPRTKYTKLAGFARHH
jgi:hypothetical protein